jgi:hypothetical protein
VLKQKSWQVWAETVIDNKVTEQIKQFNYTERSVSYVNNNDTYNKLQNGAHLKQATK